MCGIWNVSVCMCWFYDNCVGVLVICVFVFTMFCTVCTVFFIVSFMYMYSYLFCLYYCRAHCHGMTTHLQY